jgi:4-diphosphocytidyl-2-C-methyl-D-erythritol kinase
MRSLILKSPAKINLYLEVLWKRPDGYHEIRAVLQEIALYDLVYLSSIEAGITLQCSDQRLPTDERNLAFKVVKLVMEKTGFSGGVRIYLDKKIPIGGGLGGGSSNAATVIKGLNQLWNLGLTPEDMQTLGAEVGSDVPFFIYGGIALATGRGEKIYRLPPLPETWLVLINPNVEISTAWAYKNLNLALTNSPPNSNIIKILEGKENNPFLEGFGDKLVNSFENLVIRTHPIIGEMKERLLQVGARVAAMSGSGSTVFGIFNSKEEAELAYTQVVESSWLIYLTHTVNQR